MFEVGSDLVEATCFWSGFDQTDLTNYRVGTGFDCFVLGLCWVGIRDDSLANIDLARSMFAESVERLIDNPRFRWASMNNGEVAFLNFTSLLHFAEDGSVFLTSPHKKQTAGLAVESADEGKEFIGILVAQPVDQGESSIGSGGVNEPASRFIHNQKRGVFQNDRRIHQSRLVQRVVSVEV